MRTKFSQFHSQNHSHSLVLTFTTLSAQLLIGDLVAELASELSGRVKIRIRIRSRIAATAVHLDAKPIVRHILGAAPGIGGNTQKEVSFQPK